MTTYFLDNFAGVSPLQDHTSDSGHGWSVYTFPGMTGALVNNGLRPGYVDDAAYVLVAMHPRLDLPDIGVAHITFSMGFTVTAPTATDDDGFIPSSRIALQADSSDVGGECTIHVGSSTPFAVEASGNGDVRWPVTNIHAGANRLDVVCGQSTDPYLFVAKRIMVNGQVVFEATPEDFVFPFLPNFFAPNILFQDALPNQMMPVVHYVEVTDQELFPASPSAFWTGFIRCVETA